MPPITPASVVVDVEAGAERSNNNDGGAISITPAAAAAAVAVRNGGSNDDKEKKHHHPSLAKVVLLSSAGNVLEWADFSIYAYLSKQIGAAFFPPAKAEAQLIESFAVFAGAFVVRPVGGVIFGWIGDRRSKQFALQLSLFMMALSTTLIGCLPTYAQIGHAAPVLLTLLRMLQGLAVGGQLVGTMVFVHSHAPPHRHGFYGGLVFSGAVFGVLLGAVVGTLLHESFTPDALQKYGFRIPFLCGFLVALAGLGLHRFVPDVAEVEEETGPGSPRGTVPCAVHEGGRMEEEGEGERGSGVGVGGVGQEGGGIGGWGVSGASASASETRTTSSSTSSRGGTPASSAGAKPNPLKDLMTGHKAELCFGTAAIFLYCTAFYECLVWLPTYLTTLVPHAPIAGAFPITTAHLALVVLLFPLTGHLGDTYGYYPIMLSGGIFLGAVAPLAFYILRLGTPAAAFCGQLLFVIGVTVHGGPLALFMTEHMTSSPHLYSAIALAYNVAQATFGGVASLISTSLAHALHGYGAAAWLSLIALISCSALHFGYHPTRGLVVVKSQQQQQQQQQQRERGRKAVADGSGGVELELVG